MKIFNILEFLFYLVLRFAIVFGVIAIVIGLLWGILYLIFLR
jgi:vacuolar-type H+-ATPase subunit I/STV1